MHLSQIDRVATYDAKRRVLRITGTTDIKPKTPAPKCVAIHLTVMSLDGPFGSNTECHSTVPEKCLAKEEWMADFSGKFELAQITVSGLVIGYVRNNGSLHTQAWAQTVQVKAGHVYDDWKPGARASAGDAVPGA